MPTMRSRHWNVPETMINGFVKLVDPQTHFNQLEDIEISTNRSFLIGLQRFLCCVYLQMK